MFGGNARRRFTEGSGRATLPDSPAAKSLHIQLYGKWLVKHESLRSAALSPPHNSRRSLRTTGAEFRVSSRARVCGSISVVASQRYRWRCEPPAAMNGFLRGVPHAAEPPALITDSCANGYASARRNCRSRTQALSTAKPKVCSNPQTASGAAQNRPRKLGTLGVNFCKELKTDN